MTQIINTPIAVKAIGIVPIIDFRFEVSFGRFCTKSSPRFTKFVRDESLLHPVQKFAVKIIQHPPEFVRNVQPHRQRSYCH